jgi:putative hydrolase of the HAD superfamily
VLARRGIDIGADRIEAAAQISRGAHYDAWMANQQFGARDAAALYVETLADLLPADPQTHDELRDAFAATPENLEIPLVPGVRAVLAALDDAGVSLGIICDVGFTPSVVLRANLERHGVLGHFDHWSFSDEVGTYKPDPRIFGHALDGLGAAPADAWHVGDLRRTDIAGAHAAGMRAARVAVIHDDVDEANGPSGDVVVTDYAQLLPALGLVH